jgi:hypothetical protein
MARRMISAHMPVDLPDPTAPLMMRMNDGSLIMSQTVGDPAKLRVLW